MTLLSTLTMHTDHSFRLSRSEIDRAIATVCWIFKLSFNGAVKVKTKKKSHTKRTYLMAVSIDTIFRPYYLQPEPSAVRPSKTSVTARCLHHTENNHETNFRAFPLKCLAAALVAAVNSFRALQNEEAE